MNQIITLLLFFFLLSIGALSAQEEEKKIQPKTSTKRINFKKMDLIVSWSGNLFLGTPGRFLSPGSGINTRFIFQSGEAGLVGFGTSLINNEKKQDYNFDHNKPQLEKTAIGSLNLFYGMKMSLFDVLFRGGFTFQNPVDLEATGDKVGEHQLRSLVTGLEFHVPAVVSINPTQFYLSNNSNYQLGLNLHASINYNWFSLQDIRGLMFEFGLGIRFHAE